MHKIFLLIVLWNTQFLHAQKVNTQSPLSYDLMFDMTSNFSITTENQKNSNYQYVFINFQPAFVQYTISFNRSQKKKLLNAIQKYKTYRTMAMENNKEYQKRITAFTFHKIKDRKQQISSYNPSLALSFSSVSTTDHLLVFSVYKIQSNKRIYPEIFYLEHEGILQLEKLLQEDYLAQVTNNENSESVLF